jgi:uncharacterized protein YlzI (FlbEa/FlbD family)
MYRPFNTVVKIDEGEKTIYLNTEQAVRIEIDKSKPEVVLLMSNGNQYKLVDQQAQQFINWVVEG